MVFQRDFSITRHSETHGHCQNPVQIQVENRCSIKKMLRYLQIASGAPSEQFRMKDSKGSEQNN
jgi:hypothetical protein